MIRLFVRALVYFGAAAIGLLVAALLLDDMHLHVSGLILVVLIYALTQTIITPFLAKLTARNAKAFLGGVGLLASFVALLVASWFGSALDISGVGTWIAATVIVWLAGAAATVLLPVALLKAGVTAARRNGAD